MRYILITIGDFENLVVREGDYAYVIGDLSGIPGIPEWNELVTWMQDESRCGYFHFTEGVVIKVT